MKVIRGLKRALNDNGKFRYKTPEVAVDHLVIGGGVIGLAIAQRLSQLFPSKTTYLLERHSRAGEEISSRNSEVIHSGLYYPVDSLKTRLCLRGRDLMYERCKSHNIPFRQTGKLVVAKPDQQLYIENLHRKASNMTSSSREQPVLPTYLLSGEEAREMEPDISQNIHSALWCPATGIVDSHAFMGSLEKDVMESEGGQLVYSTRVVRIDPYQRSKRPANVPDIDIAENGWVVQAVTGGCEEGDAMFARKVINTSGLSSTLILNAILPQEQRIPMYYARGSYAKYHGPGVANVSHLIYPCPETGSNTHAFQSLGTHLTLDLEGQIRFGPDIEWISAPDTLSSEEDEDFWFKHLVPDESRLTEMYKAVESYLPGISLEGMQPDYVGIRPKLVTPMGGFQDFVFRVDQPTPLLFGDNHANPMISLLGIESPGLTSSLAIAELVVGDIIKADKAN